MKSPEGWVRELGPKVVARTLDNSPNFVKVNVRVSPTRCIWNPSGAANPTLPDLYFRARHGRVWDRTSDRNGIAVDMANTNSHRWCTHRPLATC